MASSAQYEALDVPEPTLAPPAGERTQLHRRSPSTESLDSDTPLMSSDESDNTGMVVKPEGRTGDVLAGGAALISVGVFLVVSWVAVLSNNPTQLGWFALHPIFQSLSISLFTYGVLTLQPTSQPKTKAAGLTRHQLVIAAIGLPCIVIGTGAMIFNKTVHEAPHFTSWHGTFGIIGFSWIIVQMALGGGSVWFGGRAFGGGMHAKAVWKYHRASGYVLLFFLLLTAYLGGAWSTWMSQNSASVSRILAYTVAPIVIIVSVYSRARLSKMYLW